MSFDVVPPTAMSAPRTASSIEARGVTGIPSAADHLPAKASRVSARREVQRISSKSYIPARHCSAVVPIVPTPTSPSTRGSGFAIHLQARQAAAAERIA